MPSAGTNTPISPLCPKALLLLLLLVYAAAKGASSLEEGGGRSAANTPPLVAPLPLLGPRSGAANDALPCPPPPPPVAPAALAIERGGVACGERGVSRWAWTEPPRGIAAN